MPKATFHKGLFGLIMFMVYHVHSQNLSGLTGITDSSYSTKTAYIKDVKNHPNIKVVREFDLKSVKATKNITYCNLGGRELLLDVFENRQKSEAPKMAIIVIHGGGWRSGNRTQHYPLAQKLADLGYVCFTPEYRLSTEALFPAAVYDIKAAIRWVRANAKAYNVDPNKLVVLGFSAGGELATFMGTTGNMPLFEGGNCETQVNSIVNAVIDIDGTLSFVHPESGEGDDRNGTSAATNWFGYSKKEKPKLWEAASPLSYVGPNTPPTLFINSSVDRMHAGRTDYIKVLNKNNIYSEIREFKEAPHSFVLYHPWFDPTIATIDLFLKRIIK